jgi:hypothetical protein
MRALIIGAGATIQEALESGRRSSTFKFPTIRNFARIMWTTFRPEPFLDLFLKNRGLQPALATDNVATFLKLEESGAVTVEQFFEFAWNQRDLIRDNPTAWKDMLYGCFFMPIVDAMSSNFFENGVGWIQLKAGQRVTAFLCPNDLVVNLNYDLAFDLAIEQSGKLFEYVPTGDDPTCIKIAKPHGSINLIDYPSQHSFGFCSPSEFSGSHESENESLSSAILPPRLNKQYAEHPIAAAIVAPLKSYKPRVLTFWGVGLTESDADLNALYKSLSTTADRVEVINPDEGSAKRTEKILGRKISWYEALSDWAAAQ